MVVSLPPKFKVPAMEMYYEGRDPLEHLETFRAHMTLHGFPSEVACRVFPLILKGPSLVLFRSLAPRSVDSFGELARLFFTQFMLSWRRWRPVVYLLTIKQGEDESLKSYLTRFNKEHMTIDDQDEKITLAALLGGFINAEDTLRALTEQRKKELERAQRKAKVPAKAKTHEKLEKSSQDNRRKEPRRGDW
ncbi:hypothetical protein F2P56_013357, partial [Juglans regia]